MKETTKEPMIIKLKDYPQLKIAHKFVTELQKCTKTYIVDRAPRDILTGKEIKVVDIFIHYLFVKNLGAILIKIIRLCDQLDLELEVNESVFNLDVVQLKAGNLNICIKNGFDSPERIYENSGLVSSQAWMLPVKKGFTVHASNLFHQLDEKKILGWYPEILRNDTEYIDRVQEKYPDHFPLALAVSSEHDDCSDFDDPF